MCLQTQRFFYLAALLWTPIMHELVSDSCIWICTWIMLIFYCAHGMLLLAKADLWFRVTQQLLHSTTCISYDAFKPLHRLLRKRHCKTLFDVCGGGVGWHEGFACISTAFCCHLSQPHRHLCFASSGRPCVFFPAHSIIPFPSFSGVAAEERIRKGRPKNNSSFWEKQARP